VNALRSAALKVLLCAVALLALVAVRCVVAARAEVSAAVTLEHAGDTHGAIVHYRRAARWYVPWSAPGAEAVDSMRRLAVGAERRGDAAAALHAWRALRGAIQSTRSLYVPFADRLRQADGRIAALMASGESPPADAQLSGGERERFYAAELARNPGAKPLWAVIALLGMLLWMGGTLAFLVRGIDEHDRVVSVEAYRLGTVVVLGLGMFLVGLALA
jgi:hypothetical protein